MSGTEEFADATQEDALAERTDNTPSADDGSQTGISQEWISEDEAIYDVAEDLDRRVETDSEAGEDS